MLFADFNKLMGRRFFLMALGASHWDVWLWLATHAVVMKGSIEAHRICLFGQVNDVMTSVTLLYRVTFLPYILFALVLMVAISAGDLVIYIVFLVIEGEILVLFTMNLVFTNHIYRCIPHLGMHGNGVWHLLIWPLGHNCTEQNDGP